MGGGAFVWGQMSEKQQDCPCFEHLSASLFKTSCTILSASSLFRCTAGAGGSVARGAAVIEQGRHTKQLQLCSSVECSVQVAMVSCLWRLEQSDTQCIRRSKAQLLSCFNTLTRVVKSVDCNRLRNRCPDVSTLWLERLKWLGLWA